MSFVLGLSMTSAGARAVLVEGAAGDGATIHTFAAVTADGLVHALSEDPVIGPALDDQLPAIGVTWSPQAGAAAATVMDDLAASGYPNVAAVAELDAADALAIGIADLAGYDDIAVCILEPDVTIVALVGRDRVTVEGIDRFEAADADEIAADVAAKLDIADADPQAVFVVGSADDLDDVVAALQAGTALPVLSAQEGDLALARGAALVAVRTPSGVAGTPAKPALLPSVGALSSVLVAATLTFVVSLSVALGLRFTPESTQEQRHTANVADERPRAISPPSVARAAPAPPPEALPPAPPPEALPEPPPEALPEAPPVREIAAAQPQWQPPPAAAPPVVEAPAPAPAPAAPPPPPVYVPPEPAYVPPPAPAYVPPASAPEYVPPPPPAHVAPPANPAPQPRIRDRIIERIPIINRFHEPQPQYPR